MEVKIVKDLEETIVSVEGRVDTITAPDLEKQVEPIWEDNGKTIVFDCEKLEYVSSSGLRVILSTHKKLTAKGGKFILRNLTSEVRSVMDLTGFSRILTIQ
ncbi:MAG: STAS domain-containing protein [Parabacteroides distasonis]|nr:STAS domain-containing protein [Parabacteroides distasonis]